MEKEINKALHEIIMQTSDSADEFTAAILKAAWEVINKNEQLDGRDLLFSILFGFAKATSIMLYIFGQGVGENGEVADMYIRDILPAACKTTNHLKEKQDNGEGYDFLW